MARSHFRWCCARTQLTLYTTRIDSTVNACRHVSCNRPGCSDSAFFAQEIEDEHRGLTLHNAETLLTRVCTRCQHQDRDFFPQRFCVEVRITAHHLGLLTPRVVQNMGQIAQPAPEEKDQVMPETFYTRVIDHTIAWASQLVQRVHHHVQRRMALLDQHAVVMCSHWQQQQPWMASISLQRRSALRFQVCKHAPARNDAADSPS